MPSTPSARLRLELQGQGESLNTWGQKLNQNALALIDAAIAGVTPITVTGDFALSATNYAADQQRSAVLVLNGTPAAPFTVTVPGTEKVWTVVNNTGRSATFRTAAGTGAVVAGGDKGTVYCDGTHCGLASLTTAQVNALIAAAGLSGALPNPAGNAGEYLRTDGTGVFWDAVPAVDLGGGAGATITASTALTAASAVVQPVNMAAAGQSVTLPDATGLSKGGRKFVIANKGTRAFGIRAHGGGLLAAVPAGGVAELHLDDNATAAGGWTVTGRGLEPALVLVDHTAPGTITGVVGVAVRLTDMLSLHFGATATGFAALAVDSTPGTVAVGTWTAVEAAGAATVAHAFRISDTQAVVFWIQGGNHKAAVLTVDPATCAIAVGTPASTTITWLGDVTYAGRPLIAQLTSTLYVTLRNSGGAILAGCANVSGAAVSIGTQQVVGTGGQQALAVHRVSDTTALALYMDDSGTAGSPYSIRGVVLSVSGTTIAVGTGVGINDTAASTSGAGLPVCQLGPTKSLVAWRDAAGTAMRAVCFTVSGTAVAAGPVLAVETGSIEILWFSTFDATRFQPNLFALDGTRALLTYCGPSGTPSRHVVLTESGGALTAGPILYGVWSYAYGGNFPQTAQGFLAFGTTDSNNNPIHTVQAVTVTGNTLAVTGGHATGFILRENSLRRFGLSGGHCGIVLGGRNNVSGSVADIPLIALYRFRAGDDSPRHVGHLTLPNLSAALGSGVPVEVAPTKLAVTGLAYTQSTASAASVRLLIVEFPA
ncbi:MAG TPA: hypothetical protein VEY95_06355 [Azospirillaceae bacterium]|nr:hypothetical protein [Azospirillaceae bacterium]